MTNALFEYDHILMRTEYRTPDPHSHLAVHLILGIGDDVICDISGEHAEAPGVFVAADVTHTAYTLSGGMLVYLFDPACRYADMINGKYLRGKSFELLPCGIACEIRSAWNRCASLPQADREILDILGFPASNVSGRDERVTAVLDMLRSLEEIPEDIVQRLCRAACLSQSRLSHLFKENIGISLHRYLAWEKMRKGYVNYQKYGSITEAAMRAGFDSPSHFAATCKRMFGISFSDFVRGKSQQVIESVLHRNMLQYSYQDREA